MKNCPVCKGLGSVDCSTCAGKGNIPCTSCRGSGWIGNEQCSSCDGAGSNSCTSCKGRGTEKCDSCDGAGQVPDQYHLQAFNIARYKHNVLLPSEKFLQSKHCAFFMLLDATIFFHWNQSLSSYPAIIILFEHLLAVYFHICTLYFDLI